ncbi:MAG: serine hydrolase domain-containing protein [Bacillota bacterium]
MSLNNELGQFQSTAFEEYVAELMEKTRAPGVAVGIAVKGQTAYFRGFGMADVEKNVPVGEHTVFGLASVTKSFTALAINQLAERGRLSLSEPVQRYLPEFNLPVEGAAGKIAIHNFLSHTSGMPPLPSLRYAGASSIPVDEEGNLMDVPPPPAGDPVIRDNKDLLRFIASHEFSLLGEPGEYVSYSNDCFSLSGEIVERVTRKSFEDYLRENVWEPLDMKDTFIGVKGLKGRKDIQGLYFRDKEHSLQKAPWKHRDVFVASGSIKSSVRDLLRYTSMYLNHGKVRTGYKDRVASRASIGRMTTPYYRVSKGAYYAYGLAIRPEYQPGITVVQHGGNIVGVASYIGFIPERNTGIVVLSNQSGFPAAKVWFAAANMILGLPAEHQIQRAPSMDVPARHLKRLSGKYVSGEGAVIEFSLQGDSLVAHMGGDTRPVRITGYDSAAIEEEGDETPIYFFFNAKGEARALRHGLRIVPKASHTD